MRWTRRAKLKTVAICLGAIVTIELGPLAVLTTLAMLGQFSRSSAFALWPALGVVGLGAFWFWAFSRRTLYGIKRAAISILIVLGMVTVSPFVFLGGVLLVSAGLGISAGAFALVEMWLPAEALERSGGQNRAG
jgi:hypothetical protein